MMTKLDEALDLYKTIFKEDFPTIPLVVTRTEVEVVKIINECVRENMDVYDLGYLTLDEDAMY